MPSHLLRPKAGPVLGLLGKDGRKKKYWLGLPTGWYLHSWVSTPVPVTSCLVQKEASCTGASSTIGPNVYGSAVLRVATLASHHLLSVPFPSSPGETERLLTRLLEVFHGPFVAQQEVRRWRVRRATWALQLFLGTVYTDVIFVLRHFW